MSQSLSHKIYSDPEFVKQYADSIIANPWNAYYERPASMSLLPEDLKGKSILDAGCGPGIVAKSLLENGGVVTAIDYSDTMVELTRKATEGKARVLAMDLNKGLETFADAEFDIIYCSLVIHYLDDLQYVFGEFARVLKPGGYLVFSTDHPESPALKDKKISGKQMESVYWKSFGIYMDVYHRTWQEIEETLQGSNFHIEQIITPQPTETCKEKYPDEYTFLKENPHFICVRAILTNKVISRNEAIDLVAWNDLASLDINERYDIILDILDEVPVDAADEKYDAEIINFIKFQLLNVTNEYLREILLKIQHVHFAIEGEPMLYEVCACCGYRTIREKGQYDICLNCFWEDDGTAEDDKVSAVNHMSLKDARNNYQQFGACSEEFIKYVNKHPGKYMKG